MSLLGTKVFLPMSSGYMLHSVYAEKSLAKNQAHDQPMPKYRHRISQCQKNWVLTLTLHVGHEQYTAIAFCCGGKAESGCRPQVHGWTGIRREQWQGIQEEKWPARAALTPSVEPLPPRAPICLQRGTLAGGRSFEDKEQCLKAGIPRENNLIETNPLSILAVKEGHVTRSSPHLGSCTVTPSRSGKHLCSPNCLGQF